jgi:hypothetical protein
VQRQRNSYPGTGYADAHSPTGYADAHSATNCRGGDTHASAAVNAHVSAHLRTSGQVRSDRVDDDRTGQRHSNSAA